MLTCAPRVPSRNSRLRYSGSPSRPSPIGQLALHLVEVQRLVALGARRPGAPRRPGSGGTKTSGSTRVVVHLGDLARPAAGSTPSAIEEHVGVEARALVPGPDLRHDAGDRDRLAAGQRPRAHHDVVELQVLALAQRHPELQRRGVLGADDPADRTAFSVVPHAGHVTARGLPFQGRVLSFTGERGCTRDSKSLMFLVKMGGGNVSGSSEVRAHTRKGWLVAVIAAAGLIAASCGDDSGGGSAASSGAPTSGGAAETSAPADTAAASDVRSRWRSDDRHRLRRLCRRVRPGRQQPRPDQGRLLQPAGRRRSRSPTRTSTASTTRCSSSTSRPAASAATRSRS